MDGSNIIDKLALLYIKDRKVLFVRSRGKDVFYTVGGKREKDETDEKVLIRETKEELGIDLIPNTITYLNSFQDIADGKENTSVKLTCYKADLVGQPIPSSEIDEIKWFSTQDTNRTTPTGKKVISWLYEKDLID